ncbi:SIMPL domain-containing protein [Bacillus pinisoli]|uniref:SIMPL domain-containing protein n=1 Tax=Bacillus pinisoli TaxID=2901866 RepID=UPI001FF1CC6B|nr:SIMPL domain-containing protein [Bacillus pinisoli]
MHYSAGKTTNHHKQVLTVYGTGVLSIQPNEIKIALGVVTRNQELLPAQQENARITQNVIQSLRQLGVTEENIQTSDYRIQPLYEYKQGSQQFLGYEISNLLSITLGDVKQAGAIIDTAVKNGANRVGNLQFSLKDETLYYQQAIKKALRNAYTTAQTLTTTMGLTLHPTPIQIIEQPPSQPPIPYQTLFSIEQAGDTSTPIQPGQIDIEAKVEVKFYYY